MFARLQVRSVYGIICSRFRTSRLSRRNRKMNDTNKNDTFAPKIEVFNAFVEPFSEESNGLGDIKPVEACCACTACTACTACG